MEYRSVIPEIYQKDIMHEVNVQETEFGFMLWDYVLA